MPCLVRKITRAKWGDEINPDQIPADAVTADLRTSSNTLSFWRVDQPSDDQLNQIVLALGAAADRIDRMDLSWIDEHCLRSREISIRESEGRTPVARLRAYHVDVTDLILDSLCIVAKSIAEALGQEQYKRFSPKTLKRLLAQEANQEPQWICSGSPCRQVCLEF